VIDQDKEVEAIERKHWDSNIQEVNEKNSSVLVRSI
jgi:hypothetical protein